MHISKQIATLLLCTISISAIAQQSNTVYGRNIISISPVQLSERTPTGVGIQYEHFIGTSDKFSFYLPVAYSFGQSDPCDPTVKARVFYAYPGIKFYPAGYKHLITYAVGTSLAFGKGTTNCDCNVPDNQTYLTEMKPKPYKPVTEAGMLINNSVNIQATSHLYFGSEIGIGASAINTQDGKNLGPDVMLQVNLKIGYTLR